MLDDDALEVVRMRLFVVIAEGFIEAREKENAM